MTSRRSFLAGLASLPLFAQLNRAQAKTATAGATPAAPRMPSQITASGETYWQELRKEFTLNTDEVFFNTGTLGASPRVVQQAVIEHMLHVDRDIARWDYKEGHENYFTGYSPETDTRAKLAAVIGAQGKDVAIVQNATFGMNLVAHGLDFAPGDEVVVTSNAHPGGRRGFDMRAKRDGIVIKEVAIPDLTTELTPQQLVDAYLAQTTAKTKVWVIPHIDSGRAILFPVAQMGKLARERGIFALVDGAQSIGHLAIDVNELGCDALFGSPHKWLLAPKGTGLLWVRPELQHALWATIASSSWDDRNDRMFALMQMGTDNLSLLHGLGVAADFHQQIGSKKIEERIVGMGDQLRAGLQKIPGAKIVSPVHAQMRTASTVYALAGKTGAQIQDYLWDTQKIRVRSLGDIGVRHTCHLYNSPADVQRTLAALAKFA